MRYFSFSSPTPINLALGLTYTCFRKPIVALESVSISILIVILTSLSILYLDKFANFALKFKASISASVEESQISVDFFEKPYKRLSPNQIKPAILDFISNSVAKEASVATVRVLVWVFPRLSVISYFRVRTTYFRSFLNAVNTFSRGYRANRDISPRAYSISILPLVLMRLR